MAFLRKFAHIVVGLGWTKACFVHHTAYKDITVLFCRIYIDNTYTVALHILYTCRKRTPRTVFFLPGRKFARHYIAAYFVSLFRQKSLDNKFNLQHMGNTLKWKLPLRFLCIKTVRGIWTMNSGMVRAVLPYNISLWRNYLNLHCVIRSAI